MMQNNRRNVLRERRGTTVALWFLMVIRTGHVG